MATKRNHAADAGGMQGALMGIRIRLYSAVELEDLEGLRKAVRDEIEYIEETLAKFSDSAVHPLPDLTETRDRLKRIRS
jgi:hypothetical protein